MNLFACPICGAPLCRTHEVLQCIKAHSFNISREGYVNLLPAHHRHTRQPGDRADMVRARRRFLQREHFEPLVDALTMAIASTGATDRLVDLGCGEGFFTSAFAHDVAQVYGMDVSKAAIKAASKRYRSLAWAVASTVKLPILDSVFEIATVILAPFSKDIARVVELGGAVIRVSPGPNHLSQLKKLVYRDARPHRRAVLELPLLRHIRQNRMEFDLMLDRQSRTDLIDMTPMQYRIRPAFKAQANESLTVTADFWIDIFEKVQ